MRTKYGNVKTHIDGIAFDSAKEAKRYTELRMLERAGLITDLELQPSFELQAAFVCNGKKVEPIRYIADFQYFDVERGCVVTEDVKGKVTDVYRLKKKLLLYRYPDIVFLET